MVETTRDYILIQRSPSLSELLHGTARYGSWPAKWLPYFGEAIKNDAGRRDWRDDIVTEPYTLHFVRTNYWMSFSTFGTRWMASFDPGTLGEVEVVESADFWKAPTSKTKVDIRSVLDYAEDKHKDDVATLKKKWKFL